MDELRQALQRAAEVIAAYREGLSAARVAPISSRGEVAAALAQALPEDPSPPEVVIEELVSGAQPGLMASAGPRYFGFVIGGSMDTALVADLLTLGWDQCAFNAALSPAALAFEDVAGSWLKELLHIPASASVGFVTGGQAANTVGLAAARWQVLHRHGWDVGRDGLHDAPRVRVLAGAERHATVDRGASAARSRRERARGGAGDAGRRDGSRGARGRARIRASRPGHRVRAVGQRQHWCVRRPECDRCRRTRGRCLAARGRRLWALGRREPAHVPARRGARARRLVGLRRAQVAQRPV